MAERYQNRQYPSAAALDRNGDQFGAARSEGDPLAELARLIGQTDPLGPGPAPAGRGSDFDYDYRDQRSQTISPGSFGENVHDISSGQQPGWVRRSTTQEQDHPQYDFANADQSFGRQDHRGYDDGEYDHVDAEDADYHQNSGYSNNDTYEYQDDEYEDEYDDEEEGGSRGGAGKWAGVLFILAILGGASGLVAYKWHPATANGGTPPTVLTDTTPTKVAPPDRVVGMTPQEKPQSESFGSQEESPVDPASQSSTDNTPVSAFPPPPPPAPAPAQTAPRRVATYAVPGQQAPDAPAAESDDSAEPPPPAAPPPTTRAVRVAPAPAQPARPAKPARQAPINLAAAHAAPAAPAAPAPAMPAVAAGGTYLVSISSQDSEAAARQSFSVAQGKYPEPLGSQKIVVSPTTMADGKVKYRASVGPFATRPDAAKLCEALKTAGGQCFVYSQAAAAHH